MPVIYYNEGTTNCYPCTVFANDLSFLPCPIFRLFPDSYQNQCPFMNNTLSVILLYELLFLVAIQTILRSVAFSLN